MSIEDSLPIITLYGTVIKLIIFQGIFYYTNVYIKMNPKLLLEFKNVHFVTLSIT